MLVHLFACLKMSSLPPKRLKRESHFSAASKVLDPVISAWARLCAMAESGPLGVLLKASVGDAARFCASRDRQSTGNSRSKPHGPKTRASCVVVQNVPLGALISKRAAAAPGRRKCHPCLTEPPPQKAPDRRGGGARRVGSARARAARGWGQGAGAAWRCLGEHVRHAGRDSFMIKDAKSETTVRWQITRGFQIWSQKCRARSVAPEKVWRAPQFIRRFNHTHIAYA